MGLRMVDGWEVSFEIEVFRWRLRFCFLQLAGAAGRERFAQLAEGQAIAKAHYESVYLHVEAAFPITRFVWDHPNLDFVAGAIPPPKRYGLKIHRYANESCGRLRVCWGTRKWRRILWGTRPPATYEGELLAEEVSKGPGEPWPED